MTPSERAEKIAWDIHKIQYPSAISVEWNKTGKEIVALLAAQIREAELKGRIDAATEMTQGMAKIVDSDCSKLVIKAREEGRASMRDEAAKVAEMWPGIGGIIEVNDPRDPTDCMNSLRKGIAERIRGIGVEGG